MTYCSRTWPSNSSPSSSALSGAPAARQASLIQLHSALCLQSDYPGCFSLIIQVSCCPLVLNHEPAKSQPTVYVMYSQGSNITRQSICLERFGLCPMLLLLFSCLSLSTFRRVLGGNVASHTVYQGQKVRAFLSRSQIFTWWESEAFALLLASLPLWCGSVY